MDPQIIHKMTYSREELIRRVMEWKLIKDDIRCLEQQVKTYKTNLEIAETTNKPEIENKIRLY